MLAEPCIFRSAFRTALQGRFLIKSKQIHNVLLVLAHLAKLKRIKGSLCKAGEQCLLCSSDNGVKVCGWDVFRLHGPLTLIF